MKYKNKQHFEEEGNLYNNSSNLKIFHFTLINMYLYKIKLANANHKKSNNWGRNLLAASFNIPQF